MNRKDLENNAPINIDIITAGNGDMTASEFGSLSTIVKDTNGNLHHFWREGMYVEGVNQNLSSHLDFTQSGHLVFFHKNKAGIILNRDLDFVRPNDAVIELYTMNNGLSYLTEYKPKALACVGQVRERIPKLTGSELWHIQLAHVCPSLMLHLYKVAEDIPLFRGLCHCCVEAKMKHAPEAQWS